MQIKFQFTLFYIFFISLLIIGFEIQASDGYAERVESYIEQVLSEATGGTGKLIYQAHQGLPLDEEVIASELEGIQNSNLADFTITSLVRALFLSDGSNDDQFEAGLETFPFWLPDTDPNTDRQYWSENHMIMWMSANWLLHERYGWEIRPTLRQMIVKWLDLKIEYGYYEYFSTVYYRFTLAAMLNLHDFAEDEEIKNKAALAINKQLSDLLLAVNDQGNMYPTSGRNEIRTFFSSNEAFIYFLTGFGEQPSGGISTVALATTTLDVTDLCESWSSKTDTTLYYGHPISEGQNILGELDRQDRIIFQWSAGGYFHPDIAEESLWAINNFNLWEHEEFSAAAFAQFVPPAFATVFANIAGSISRSSYIGNAEIDIYKNNGVVLTSTHNLWKGHGGYQVYPVVATIENTPVMTRSGEIFADWHDVPNRRSNDHMPYVNQDENVALIMYRANWDLPLWGFEKKPVALRWDNDAFDEEQRFDNWNLGRINNSYVAVKKHCDDEINGIQACRDAYGQTWAIVVGNQEEHGSFDEFEAIINESIYEERWYFNWQNFKWVYYGHINVDGKDIDHHWEGSFLNGPYTGNTREATTFEERSYQLEDQDISIFPNPAKEYITIDLRNYEKEIASISIINIAGQEMYNEHATESNSFLKTIPVQNWTNGIYTLLIENYNGSTSVKRLIIHQ